MLLNDGEEDDCTQHSDVAKADSMVGTLLRCDPMLDQEMPKILCSMGVCYYIKCDEFSLVRGRLHGRLNTIFCHTFHLVFTHGVKSGQANLVI